MWTKNDLQQLIYDKLGDYRFIVVSNRQPVVHTYRHGKIQASRTPGGVVTALEPVMQACQGTWIAYGNGNADSAVSDSKGRIRLPEHDPSYTLRRIWLSKQEVEGYYNGFSNEALWPLCHLAFQRPVFREEDWEHYVEVNRKFAEAVVEEAEGAKAFVWIQDYHLCLLPKFLKEMGADQFIVAHFWHIPWPAYETFRICRHKKELLEGMLANDLIGFQIMYHCNNFVDVVDRELESKIDRETLAVIRGGHKTLIRAFPISVDFESIDKLPVSEMETISQGLMDEFGLGKMKIVVGVERVDYTKGIQERLKAVDAFLEKYPEFKEKVIFVYKGAESRIHVPRYKALNHEINALIEEINWKHSTGSWKPILSIERDLSYKEIMAFYRLGDVCVVSSLHDGMNLVAKEYVANCRNNNGVLVLSQFTGAAREFTDAVLINPYDTEHFSEALFQALTMPPEETEKRMKLMREVLQENNIYTWAGKVIAELFKLESKL